MKYEVSFFAMLILAGTALTGGAGVSEALHETDRPARPAARAVSGPIGSSGELLRRLELEHGFEVPDESWEALEGQAPVLDEDALGLALRSARESARRLLSETEVLEREVAAGDGANLLVARSRSVRRLARVLLDDPYLAFLDMGRTARSRPTSDPARLDSAARQLHEDAGRLLAEIESLLAPEDARVVDWRTLSRPSPRQLASRLAHGAETIERLLSTGSTGAADTPVLAR